MRFIPKNISSIIISLILAILVWIAAVQEQNPTRTGEYDHNIPIEIIPPAAGTINTAPLPEFIRLRLVAPENSWEALTPSKFKASADLSQLPEGLSDVPISVEVSDRRVNILELIPSEVTVNLEAVQTISTPVEVEILDTPPLGYFNKPPVVDPAVVQITGPASVVSQVGKSVSQIFIRNSKETIQTLRDVIVRNREDQALRGLEIEPTQVLVTVPIEQRFGYKDASVRVVVNGQVAQGYRVSNISVDPPAVTLVGNPQGLNEISGLVETVPINLDEATETIARNVPLNLPDGVAVVSGAGQNDTGLEGVVVNVEITPIENSISLRRPIVQQGIDPEYWWRAAPDRADVFLSGPIPQLEMLRASDVEVIVDLFELAPGVYKLQPTVFHPEGLRVDAILPDPIEVTIGRTVEKTVTQQGLDPDYTWQASPNRVDVHLLGNSEQLQSVSINTVRAVVNLAGLEPGIHQLTPIGFAPGVEVDSVSPTSISVTIQLRSTPTPAASTEASSTPESEEDN